jgi:ABC-type antimicrobial peptide transport system permease subunit
VRVHVTVAKPIRRIAVVVPKGTGRRVVVGMLLAVGASYLLRAVLYGVHFVDSVSFLGSSLLFLIIALLATLPASSRATRVDPMVALRYE